MSIKWGLLSNLKLFCVQTTITKNLGKKMNGSEQKAEGQSLPRGGGKLKSHATQNFSYSNFFPFFDR